MAPIPLFGQAANSPVVFANQDAVTTTFVHAPNYGGTNGNGGGGDNNQWLKVEFHYSVTPATGDYQDAVEFKVWIEGRDLLDPQGKPGEGIAVALTGSVAYVNIPKGKDCYGVFYVHPSTLGRYSTDRGYEDFDRKFDVHIEAFVNGAKMDYSNKNKEDDAENWYKPLRVVPGLVYRQDQTPFIMADPDRYPAIKLPTTTQ
ncbi:MAG: hypothetical protein LV479_00340 [Methylacidiphilales bacterium]|nr:hypothetical protein [Candidatus Methylacidiphilales bacterium]